MAMMLFCLKLCVQINNNMTIDCVYLASLELLMNTHINVFVFGDVFFKKVQRTV